MNPEELYKQRTASFKNKADLLEKRGNKLSVARLISFISGPVLFVFLFSISTAAATIMLVVCIVVFAWLVKYHIETEKEKIFYRHLETINSLEKQCLEGDFSKFPDGSEYISREHPNAYDLDLFGHASVFQYINRTASKPAADLLALWLMHPAQIDEIFLRQQGIAEMKSLIEWRQKLITFGYVNENAGKDPNEMINWVQGKNYFGHPKRLRAIVYAMSSLGIVGIIMVIMGVPAAILIPLFGLNFMFYFTQGKKISRLHNQVGRYSEMLKTYASVIGLIEKQPFESQKLKDLQNIFVSRIPVSVQIHNLSRLVSRLDARLNVMVSVPLNLLFFWDIHCCLALEKWKNMRATLLEEWFRAMAEFEVLSSISNMTFNNPGWIMPEVISDYFVLKAENAGHPLIPEGRRVTNTIHILQSSKTVLITGSNMSGKSTFLRTCGVNTVLAMMGAPVCAASFTISHVQVFSSMRISDSLEDNTSSFYAELKRLAAIIKEAERNQKVFLLLDEILRGTNSNDRYIGSVALIKQLIGFGTVSIVATHDLRLADLAAELPANIDNYHFDVKIDGEELYFDYTLTPGICKTLNASILMKKMGIRV